MQSRTPNSKQPNRYIRRSGGGRGRGRGGRGYGRGKGGRHWEPDEHWKPFDEWFTITDEEQDAQRNKRNAARKAATLARKKE
jgi:hypothetical protein